MNKAIILLALVLTSPYAKASKECSSLFLEKSISLIAQPKSESHPAIVSETTYEMIINAMRRDIEQGFQSPRYFRVEPIQQLLKMGLSREEIAAEIRQDMENELREMAKVSRIHFELPAKPAPQVSMVENVLNPKVSIVEFIEYYNLRAEQTVVTNILNYRDTFANDRANPIEILKTAILTGQKDLAREAFIQSFRFNKLNDLVELGIETGDNDILMNIGRISITKFLLFDRNQNYLQDGLNALLEVKGTHRKQAESLLIDFVDILKSPEIFKNEDSVGNYGEKGNKAFYLELALKALKSASTLTGRIPRDSISYHRFVETRDQRILSRMREIIKMGQNMNSSLGLDGTYAVLAILKDSKLTESFANNHLKIRFMPQESASDLIKERLPKLHANRAIKYALLTADVQFVRNVIKEIMTNDPMDKAPSLRDGIQLFDEGAIILKSVTSPSKYVALLGELAKDKSLTLGQLEFLKNTRKNLIQDLRGVNKEKPNLNTDLFVTHEYDMFSHHKQVIESFIKNEDPAFKYQGLWAEFNEASRQRDIQKLKIVYQKMMSQGRGLDAVYAAFTIAVLENGGNINTLQALEKARSNRQIEKQ
ncbi:MAG: hypothetical protein V4596_12115 [Bdellovibrionota bacterium]